MDRQEYTMMAELMLKVPPKSETPEGQKFHIGEIVRISNPLNWYSKQYTKGQLFEVQYSYSQKYGGSDERNKKQYSLKHLFEENSSAWYDEDELELVKGIDEINEERDLSEYKRLKAKYEGLSNGSRITEQPFCQTRVMCRAVDNLELLLSQPDESVDLIYCDILYGTGRKFADYQDLKPIRSEIESHYIPRIKEMHRILKPTGSIYLQMDTRINHWMRCIMDDIFGYDKFRNEISWWYKRWSNISFGFQKMHDVILFYSKDKSKFNIQYQDYSKPNEIEDTVRGVIDGKLVRLKNEDGSYKKRENENKGVPLHDIWEIQHIQPTAKERLGYDTQKPKALIERIIKASSNEGDTVADYYLGSGTTAVVCKELNRNFIGCDINPKAIEITNARLDAVS